METFQYLTLAIGFLIFLFLTVRLIYGFFWYRNYLYKLKLSLKGNPDDKDFILNHKVIPPRPLILRGHWLHIFTYYWAVVSTVISTVYLFKFIAFLFSSFFHKAFLIILTYLVL